MVTKRTKSKRRLSDLKFNMALMNLRQQNLSIMVQDSLCFMRLKIEQLEREVKKLKEESHEDNTQH